MALPVLDKTWQFDVNNIVIPQASTLATSRRTIRTAIKDVLIGFGSSPWTVQGSSNSVAAAMDAVDRWAADANLVWANAGTAHSWIVLRQTGVATNFELCMDLSAAEANGLNLTWVVSTSAGFTGGTTLNRPTATDEQVQANTTWGPSATNAQLVTHLMQSTDGQCTRIVICRANLAVGLMVLDRVKNPVTGWTTPSYSLVAATNGGSETATITNMFTNANGRGRFSTFNMNLWATMKVTTSSFTAIVSNQNCPNDISAELPMAPMGVVSETASARGRHGQLFDIWFGLTSLSTGNAYPYDDNKQFVQFGDIILPWDGATSPVVIG
jgi:hypothetical protein